jgi:hypothetical protein
MQSSFLVSVKKFYKANSRKQTYYMVPAEAHGPSESAGHLWGKEGQPRPVERVPAWPGHHAPPRQALRNFDNAGMDIVSTSSASACSGSKIARQKQQWRPFSTWFIVCPVLSYCEHVEQ